MVLDPTPEGGTNLTWNARVTVSGTLANRVMGSVARRMTGDFFNCVKTRIESRSEA